MVKGGGGGRVEGKPVKSLPALYNACMCVCACVVESYCALCECACRALSQVGEVEKRQPRRRGEGGGGGFLSTFLWHRVNLRHGVGRVHSAKTVAV